MESQERPATIVFIEALLDVIPSRLSSPAARLRQGKGTTRLIELKLTVDQQVSKLDQVNISCRNVAALTLVRGSHAGNERASDIVGTIVLARRPADTQFPFSCKITDHTTEILMHMCGWVLARAPGPADCQQDDADAAISNSHWQIHSTKKWLWSVISPVVSSQSH